jgi:hypothetical protein
MRILATVLLTLFTLTDPTLISKINGLKADAKKAYLKNDFKTAIKKYRYLVDSLNVREDEVLVNLASAYYNLKDTTNAISQYQSLTASSKKQLRSKAQQQLGLIADQQGKQQEALSYFKEAIKSDVANEEARYNYELLKKKIEEKEKKKQDQKKQDEQNKDKDKEKKDQDNKEEEKKDQEKKDQEQKEKEKKEQEKKEKQDKQKEDQQKKDQEQKDKEQKEKEEQDKKDQEKKMPPDVKQKLEDMKISPEKAEMLLEAMRIQEKQYLQQNKRKATKPKEKGKPDW